MDPHFHVVLIEPEIPNNTGNIGRTCVATGSMLHLVEPLGFEITDKKLRRAGLDYWPHLKWATYPNWENCKSRFRKEARIFYLTTKSKNSIFDVRFQEGDCFVFGKETRGLSEELLRANDAQALTIPQLGPVRSLNLANAVAITLYEAIRQVKLE